jgi:type IV pilus assembly protein PilB
MKRLGELLVEAGALDALGLERALLLQQASGRKLGQVLVDEQLLTEAQLTQTLSRQLAVPWVALHQIDFSPSLLALVPRDVACRFGVVPIFVRHIRGRGDTLYVATDDPTNLDALAEIGKTARMPVKSMIASSADIQLALEHYDVREPLPAVRTRTVPPPPLAAEQFATTPTAFEVAARPPPPTSIPVPRAPAIAVNGSLPSSSTPRVATPVPPSEELSTRDIISALRASALGADATEILGRNPRWESAVATLMSVLLKKGVLDDADFVAAWRKR